MVSPVDVLVLSSVVLTVFVSEPSVVVSPDDPACLSDCRVSLDVSDPDVVTVSDPFTECLMSWVMFSDSSVCDPDSDCDDPVTVVVPS